MNELADELIVVVFVLFVLPHKSIIISHHANTNIHTLPSHPPHNIFMNRVSSHSEQSSLSSIRAIREKMEANRSRTKGVLSPFTMPLPEAAKGTFEAQVQEQREMCDQAVKKLKEGSSIVIDWTTRSNFRVRTELPKLKTEPLDFSMLRKIGSRSIESKRIELAKLLHERNKKQYLKSKTQQEQEARLFGSEHRISLRHSYLQRSGKKSRRSEGRRLSQANRTIESAQQHLMQHCKLNYLRDELKQKFQEIRDLYNKKFDRRDRPILGRA